MCLTRFLFILSLFVLILCWSCQGSDTCCYEGVPWLLSTSHVVKVDTGWEQERNGSSFNHQWRILQGLGGYKPPSELFACQFEHSYRPALSRTLRTLRTPPPPPKNSCIRPWSYVGLIHLFIFPMGVVLFRKSVKEDWNTLNMWNNLISTYTLFIRARTNKLLIGSVDTYIGVSILCTSIISKYTRQYNSIFYTKSTTERDSPC